MAAFAKSATFGFDIVDRVNHIVRLVHLSKVAAASQSSLLIEELVPAVEMRPWRNLLQSLLKAMDAGVPTSASVSNRVEFRELRVT